MVAPALLLSVAVVEGSGGIPCYSCREVKGAADFYPCNLRNWDYLCKVCTKRRVDANRRTDPVKRLSDKVRAREKRKGRPMSLTLSDFRMLLKAADVHTGEELSRLLHQKLITVVRAEGEGDASPLTPETARVAVFRPPPPRATCAPLPATPHGARGVMSPGDGWQQPHV